MKVSIPQPLLSYTGGARQVEAEGSDLASLLLDLNQRHPGLRFRIIDEQDRIREHIRLFVNGKQITRDSLADFIATLDLPEPVKDELRAMTPATYTGVAAELARNLPRD